ncbi:glutaredoxin family protein [Parapedobacter soli]|uniref:glutaredoxin family protein n=1 Tax=Parapedobacter soli TaxID=416955 RepID=UPI0021C98146|nr:glutaredoxin family protein [Parapedobacter soli]
MTRIIKFEKNDCVPCNQVSEFLDRRGVSYEKVNPFDKPELAIQYKVRTVPTVIVLNQDQETQRIIGFKPEELSALTVQ